MNPAPPVIVSQPPGFKPTSLAGVVWRHQHNWRPYCTLRVTTSRLQENRIHNLRHRHASHTVMNGPPVPVVSRLLGHSNVHMTLRYAHLGDRDVKAAAESTRTDETKQCTEAVSR